MTRAIRIPVLRLLLSLGFFALAVIAAGRFCLAC